MEAESKDLNIKKSAFKCGKKLKMNLSFVKSCAGNTLGNFLQHEYGVLTENLNPPHTYVPWVTLNGEHTEEIENQAMDDLKTLICKTYKVWSWIYLVYFLCLVNFILGFKGKSKPNACN